MAAALYLVKKTGSDNVVNGIDQVLINNDDGDADALIITNTAAALRAAGQAIPDGYFDTVTAVGPAAYLDTEFDYIAVSTVSEVVA